MVDNVDTCGQIYIYIYIYVIYIYISISKVPMVYKPTNISLGHLVALKILLSGWWLQANPSKGRIPDLGRCTSIYRPFWSILMYSPISILGVVRHFRTCYFLVSMFGCARVCWTIRLSHMVQCRTFFTDGPRWSLLESYFDNHAAICYILYIQVDELPLK